MSKTTYRAAKYIRLSYADDKEGGPTAWRTSARCWTASLPPAGHRVVSEKVDDGVSGIIFDRKAFKEMMAEIEAGKSTASLSKTSPASAGSTSKPGAICAASSSL
jgi:DNA invertase Pin-like site-specific DNA recombinase